VLVADCGLTSSRFPPLKTEKSFGSRSSKGGGPTCSFIVAAFPIILAAITAIRFPHRARALPLSGRQKVRASSTSIVNVDTQECCYSSSDERMHTCLGSMHNHGQLRRPRTGANWASGGCKCPREGVNGLP